MAVDLQELLAAASGERIGRSSDTSLHFLGLMDRVFLKTVSEPDIMETAAAREVMRRESPIEPVKPT